MAKIIEGVALAVGTVLAVVLTGGAASPMLAGTWAAFLTGTAVSMGISLTLGGIAQQMQPGATMPFSTKQPAAPRQCIYGQARVAGIIVYESTSGNGHDLNQVIVWAGHPISSIDTVYLDSRALHLPGGIGGQDTGGTYYDDNGNSYSYGSSVVCWKHTGGTGGFYFADLGSRDSNWNSSCTLNGLAACYLRFHFDSNKFSGPPGVKANVHGKCDIYDPRSHTYGYTNNWALCVADFLCNKEWGLGCDYATEIDEAQLIAAANLCDEQVTLAAGGTESRYTLNGCFDTQSLPGDILEAMLASAEGRISYTGGRWRIFPAAWYGSGLLFGAGDIIGAVRWTSARKTRDKFNAVRGTFVSPRYPYASIGYDQDNKNTGIWSGQWQPTDYPEYAQDARHGYASDANQTADGGRLYAQRPYRFVISLSMAQRLAKVYLLRNRQQGSGTLQMSLSAYQCLAQDVIQVTFPALGWANKYLEVQTVRFLPKIDKDGTEAPSMYVELDVVETDPSVYLWSTAEERGLQDTPSPTLYCAQTPNPPTSLTLTSGSGTAVVGVDGITIPRIHVQWIEPDDPFVLSGGYVELQWQRQGDTTWVSAGYFGSTATDYYLASVVANGVYLLRIRSVRSNGPTSAWVTSTTHTVSSTVSSISTVYINGLGNLASKNNVDFATGEVTNKGAAYISYSNGLTVDSLRPAEPNAEQTAGKSIDLLADGSVYVRIKGSQAVGGVITGKSYGNNLVANFGFENNLSGSPVGDDWSIIGSTPSFTCAQQISSSTTGWQVSGNGNLWARCQDNQTLPANSGWRGVVVRSTPIPVQGGDRLLYGGSMSVGWNVAPTSYSGLSVLARINLYFVDNSGNTYAPSTGTNLDTINATYPYQQRSNYVMVPAGATLVQLECSAWVINNSASPITLPTGTLVSDVRWDNMFLCKTITQRELESVMVANRGSALAGTSSPLTSSDAGNGTASITVAAFQLQTGYGVVSYNGGNITGLAYNTRYYVYANDPSLSGGSVAFAATSAFAGVVSSSGYVYVDTVVTPAQGSTSTTGQGTGGGSGSGGGTQTSESGYWRIGSTYSNGSNVSMQFLWSTSNVPVGHNILLQRNGTTIGSGLSGSVTIQLAFGEQQGTIRLIDATTGIVLQG